MAAQKIYLPSGNYWIYEMKQSLIDKYNEAAGIKVDTKQLDDLVRDFRKTREDYDEKKKISTEAFHLVEKKEANLLRVLQKMSIAKHRLIGVGTVSLKTETSVKIPKTIPDKIKFWQWLKGKGAGVMWENTGIDSKSLNSLYKQEHEKAEAAGKSKPIIPGLEEPKEKFSVRLRKEKQNDRKD